MAETSSSRTVQQGLKERRISNVNSFGKEKKVRFEDDQRASSVAKLSEKSRVPVEGAVIKDKKTGELLPFGEHHPVQQTVEGTAVIQESEEVRLKGKLRWLFEQDRMFWESNDSKSTSESKASVGEAAKPCSDQQTKVSEVCSRTKARNSRKDYGGTMGSERHLSASFKTGLHEDGKGQKQRGSFQIGKDRQSKQTHKREEATHCEVHGKPSSIEKSGLTKDREYSSPVKSWEFRDAKGSFDEVSGGERPGDEFFSENKGLSSKESSQIDRHPNSASMNLPWGFNNNKSKLVSEDGLRSETLLKGPSKTRLSPDRRTTLDTPSQTDMPHPLSQPPKLFKLPEVRPSPFVEAEVSELDLGGGDAYFTDYEDAATNSPEGSCSEDENETHDRTKVRAAGYGEDMNDRTTFLIAKCDLLAKEKEIAVRKWKRSCGEIEQAAQMAQALRSAIETLLEVSIGSDPTADFRSKRTSLEEHTRALRVRMERLRRRSAELHPHPEPEDLMVTGSLGGSKTTDTFKKKTTTSDVQGLATPEVPTDTETKVEDLKARLEKLMLATNSRVTDEREHVMSRPREKKKKPPKDSLHPEKAELKMKGWYNSLSAELAANSIDFVQSNSRIDKCDVSSDNGHTREPSNSATPTTSKQVSPLHSLHQLEDTASTHSSEETRMRVIHKIAEEVRAESEQWYQVQELLQRVGEDMKRLQEACSAWERRALVAEAQVETLHHEDQERKEKSQTGDQKVAQLQVEIVRLRETVDEVRKQLSSVDPSRWFEAANKFGYAFVPVMRPTLSGSLSFRHEAYAHHESRESRDDRARRELRQKSAMDCDVSADHRQPSCSVAGTREKARTVSARRDHTLPSSQWANEIAKAEEDEIFQSKRLGTSDSHKLLSLEFVTSSVTEDVPPPERHEALLSKHEKSHRPLVLETKSDESVRDEPKEALPVTPTPKEGAIDDLPRTTNLSSLTRSPLKVVLGNVAPSKENKKPFLTS